MSLRRSAACRISAAKKGILRYKSGETMTENLTLSIRLTRWYIFSINPLNFWGELWQYGWKSVGIPTWRTPKGRRFAARPGNISASTSRPSGCCGFSCWMWTCRRPPWRPSAPASSPTPPPRYPAFNPWPGILTGPSGWASSPGSGIRPGAWPWKPSPPTWGGRWMVGPRSIPPSSFSAPVRTSPNLRPPSSPKNSWPTTWSRNSGYFPTRPGTRAAGWGLSCPGWNWPTPPWWRPSRSPRRTRLKN